MWARYRFQLHISLDCRLFSNSYWQHTPFRVRWVFFACSILIEKLVTLRTSFNAIDNQQLPISCFPHQWDKRRIANAFEKKEEHHTNKTRKNFLRYERHIECSKMSFCYAFYLCQSRLCIGFLLSMCFFESVYYTSPELRAHNSSLKAHNSNIVP